MAEAIEDIENALDIPIPTSDTLVLDDDRRLTGPGLLWNEAGAVLDGGRPRPVRHLVDGRRGNRYAARAHSCSGARAAAG